MSNLNDYIETAPIDSIKLLILCGFPYAGKSYAAERILKETDNIVLVSIDDIFHKNGFDWATSKLPNETEWQRIFEESYRQIKEVFEKGKSVLYDSTNQTIESRDRLRAIAKEYDVESQVIYVKSDIETIWKRWEENQKNPNRSVVSRDLVQMTIDMFEEPEEWECVTVIEN